MNKKSSLFGPGDKVVLKDIKTIEEIRRKYKPIHVDNFINDMKNAIGGIYEVEKVFFNPFEEKYCINLVEEHKLSMLANFNKWYMYEDYFELYPKNSSNDMIPDLFGDEVYATI